MNCPRKELVRDCVGERVTCQVAVLPFGHAVVVFGLASKRESGVSISRMILAVQVHRC